MRTPDPVRSRLLTALLVLTAVTTARLWWVPARCLLDENEFTWGESFGAADIGGQGLGGDLLVLLLLSGYAVSMLDLGWSGGRRPFAAMALVWYGVHLASSIVSATEGGTIFYGDAIGLRVNITWIALAVNGLGLALALAWAVRDIRGSTTAPLVATARTRRLELAALALLPVQVILFQIGPLHDPTDLFAIALTVGQWGLLNVAWVAQRSEPEGIEANLVPTTLSTA